MWLPVRRGLLPFCHKLYRIYPHIGCTAIPVFSLRFQTRQSQNPKSTHIELVVKRSPGNTEEALDRTVTIVHPLLTYVVLEIAYNNTSSDDFRVYSYLVLGRKLRVITKVDQWKMRQRSVAVTQWRTCHEPVMGRNPVLEKRGVETSCCIRSLIMRHFQVKTLPGHEFAFRRRTKDRNMKPEFLFLCYPRASCIVQ